MGLGEAVIYAGNDECGDRIFFAGSFSIYADDQIYSVGSNDIISGYQYFFEYYDGGSDRDSRFIKRARYRNGTCIWRGTICCCRTEYFTRNAGSIIFFPVFMAEFGSYRNEFRVSDSTVVCTGLFSGRGIGVIALLEKHLFENGFIVDEGGLDE